MHELGNKRDGWHRSEKCAAHRCCRHDVGQRAPREKLWVHTVRINATRVSAWPQKPTSDCPNTKSHNFLAFSLRCVQEYKDKAQHRKEIGFYVIPSSRREVEDGLRILVAFPVSASRRKYPARSHQYLKHPKQCQCTRQSQPMQRIAKQPPKLADPPCRNGSV